MNKKTNIARLICEAGVFTVRYGLGTSERFMDLDAEHDCDAFAEFKFERVNDNLFEVTTMQTYNEDALKAIDSLTEFNVPSTIDEDDLVHWLFWIVKHFDWIEYGNYFAK